MSQVRESARLSFRRSAADHVVKVAVFVSFLIALIPLGGVLFATVTAGVARFDVAFFTQSMRGVVGEGGGILHALVGTLLITGAAIILAVPVGVLTALYMTHYASKKVVAGFTFLTDIMSGIPSIVAGLFAYAAFSLLLGPGTKMGISGALALAVLMLPTVVRSTEEVLKLVPREVEEGALALGSPKWVMVLKVVLPTAFGGIMTGVLLGVARIIGETAPLLVAAGFSANMNFNIFVDRMQSLPVYVYTQISNQGNPAEAFMERAWGGALVLILVVVAINLVSRLVVARFKSNN